MGHGRHGCRCEVFCRSAVQTFGDLVTFNPHSSLTASSCLPAPFPISHSLWGSSDPAPFFLMYRLINLANDLFFHVKLRLVIANKVLE